MEESPKEAMEEHENERNMHETKQRVAEVYLEKMGYSMEQLEKYLRAIDLCRKYECG